MEIQLDPAIVWILRLSLGALFASAALHKVRDLSDFENTLADYEIIPRSLTRSATLGLIFAEAMIAIGLVAGLATPGAAAGIAAAGLLVVYAMAIAVNLSRGRRNIDCGCLGPNAPRQTLSGWLLVRNGVLSFGAGLTCLTPSPRDLGGIDSISILGGLVLLTLIFNAANLLASAQAQFTHQERVS